MDAVEGLVGDRWVASLSKGQEANCKTGSLKMFGGGGGGGLYKNKVESDWRRKQQWKMDGWMEASYV